MEFVDGKDLWVHLEHRGRLPEAEAIAPIEQIAQALDEAHEQGMIHRDVKPDNILLDDESGRAVLTDFGIAKALAGGQTVTRVGVVVGTPQYMSPEQAGGRDTLDGRSDIYSLGVAAYAMLAGRPPFEGGTPQDVLVKRLTAEAPSLAEVASDVPEDLAAAVMRCLRRDPAARWPDARALREAVSPTSLEADQLPEPLDTLDGTGPFLLPFVLLFLALAVVADFARFVQPRGMEEGLRPGTLHILFMALLAGFMLMQLPIMWSAVRVARARGFTWRQIRGAALRQPEWWVCFWYPRSFRRPGDVWDRLPSPIRSWRIIVTALVADLMACFALGVFMTSATSMAIFGWMETHGGPRADDVMSHAVDVLKDTMILAFVLGLALTVTAAFGAWFMRGQGFDTYTLRRVSRTLVMGCTSQRGPWKKPEVAQVLLPAPSAQRRLEPRTAGEALAALAAAVRRLPTEARGRGRRAGGRGRPPLAQRRCRRGGAPAREAGGTPGVERPRERRHVRADRPPGRAAGRDGGAAGLRPGRPRAAAGPAEGARARGGRAGPRPDRRGSRAACPCRQRRGGGGPCRPGGGRHLCPLGIDHAATEGPQLNRGGENLRTRPTR
jgi:hypothetical protein